MTYDKNSITFVEKPTVHNFKDLDRHTFGRLTVLGYAGRHNAQSFWYCECSCGTVVRVNYQRLAIGQTQSCGCFRHDRTSETKRKHGGAGKHPLYSTWNQMRGRCQNPANHAYESYGGRGIEVCERWDDFALFVQDMGDRPEGTSLERQDVNGDYCPENCVWATQTEQANNTRTNMRLTYQGRTQTLAQWCRELNMNYGTTHSRLYKWKWSVEKAFDYTNDNTRQVSFPDPDQVQDFS